MTLSYAVAFLGQFMVKDFDFPSFIGWVNVLFTLHCMKYGCSYGQCNIIRGQPSGNRIQPMTGVTWQLENIPNMVNLAC